MASNISKRKKNESVWYKQSFSSYFPEAGAFLLYMLLSCVWEREREISFHLVCWAWRKMYKTKRKGWFTYKKRGVFCVRPQSKLLRTVCRGAQKCVYISLSLLLLWCCWSSKCDQQNILQALTIYSVHLSFFAFYSFYFITYFSLQSILYAMDFILVT
jgi:hypothetical protein